MSAQDVFLMLDLNEGEEGNFSTKLARVPANWFQRVGPPEMWDAVTPHQIIFNLPGVNLDISFLLSDEWATGVMSRQHWDDVGGEDGYISDPVGNGPWSFISREIGGTYLHERVEDHWRITPEFHELAMIQVQEPATRLAMLLANEAEIIPLVRTQRQLVESRGFKTFRSTLPSVHQAIGFANYREFAFCSDDGTTTGNFDPNGTPPPRRTAPCGPSGGWSEDIPIRNPLVRKAMALAVNRNEINDVFYQGQSFPLVDYYPPWRDDFQDR